MHPKSNHWTALVHYADFLKAERDNIWVTYQKPKKVWFIAAANANFSQDKINWRSVSGAVCTLGRTITGWLFKLHHLITISDTEVEYCALALATQELIFVSKLVPRNWSFEETWIYLRRQQSYNLLGKELPG